MKKETILIVDDEEDILELIKFNLEKEGYSIVKALTGEKAVKIARQTSIDLIVLDLMLPGMDGLEVTKFLKADEKTWEIPIIMLTAKGKESDIIKLEGGLVIDSAKYVISINDDVVGLTLSEFDLLSLLANKKGWVFTRGQIVDAIRGENYAVTERSVDVIIAGLRKKLKNYAFVIETVRGVGYRFKE